MTPPVAPGTGGIPLPARDSQRPGRRSQYPSFQTAVDEAVDEALVHDRLARLETEFSNFKRDFQERRHLSITAKATIAVAIIGALGAIGVVVVQGAMKFQEGTAKDSVKQSTIAAVQVVASSTPATTDIALKAAQDGADIALAKLRKQQKEDGLVTVPSNWVIKGKKIPAQE